MTIRQFVNQWKQPYESNMFQQNFLLLVNTLGLLFVIQCFSWISDNATNGKQSEISDKVMQAHTLHVIFLPILTFWFVLIRPLKVVQKMQWDFFTIQMNKFVYPWLDELLPPLYINPNIVSLNQENIRSVTDLKKAYAKNQQSIEDVSMFMLSPNQILEID